MLSVYFKCEYCLEVWVTHCRRRYRPKDLCTKCLEDEQNLTSHILVLATNLSILELDSPEWYKGYKNGIRGKLDSKAEIIEIKCRKLNKAPCSADAVKIPRWGTFKRQYVAWSRNGTPEEYSCCRENGLPCRWWQPREHTPMGNPAGPEPSRVQDN